jgi:hypothetical protein
VKANALPPLLSHCQYRLDTIGLTKDHDLAMQYNMRAWVTYTCTPLSKHIGGTPID